MHSGQYSQYFSDYRALLPYSVLGLIAGLLSALAVLCFEWAIRVLGSLWLGEGSPDSFESLQPSLRFALPVAGGAFLGLLFTLLRSEDRETGIVHVISRMHSHYGQLPLRNALVQFLGGAIALASGHSGGREGPGVHLGAAINSSLANRIKLPNNSQRILIACGTAGSIAAAFNTPLAGVVFAMEVIVAEYTVIGFTPVILAAISATAVSRVFGAGLTTFRIPPVELTSLLELPFILSLGFVAGALVALFIFILKHSLRLGNQPVLLRFISAGALTGGIGLLVPEVLGLGYDSLESAVFGQLAPLTLALLIAAKLLTTSVSVGLGLPVGVIGPSLLIGGCVGGLMGFWGGALIPQYSSDPTLYVVIGMGAAMAAMLNAPLAALLAVVELTGNVSVVFPTMLAIVAATLTVTIAFRTRSAHQTVLHHLKRIIPDDPISQLLHQTNVLSAMDRSVRVLEHWAGPDALGEGDTPNWCLLKRDEEYLFLVRGTDVADATSNCGEDGIDLLEQDMRRWTLTRLTPRSTLREALDALRGESVEAVIIVDPRVAGNLGVRGVLSRDIIDQFYLMKL